MVDDGQYAVMALALRQPRDQIHGHLSKGGVAVGYRDLVKRRLHLVREILVLLTDRAPFYVLLDPGAPPGPAEAFEYFPGGLVVARVSHQSVVIGVHDALADSFIRRDDRLLVLIEPQASIVDPSLRFLPPVEPGLVLLARFGQRPFEGSRVPCFGQVEEGAF